MVITIYLLLMEAFKHKNPSVASENSSRSLQKNVFLFIGITAGGPRIDEMKEGIIIH